MGSIGNSSKTKTETSSNESVKGILSRSRVDEYTKDYTPEMFLGKNFKDSYINLAGLKLAAEDNAPKELNIEGYTFNKVGQGYASFEKNKDIVVLNYQSTEQYGNEYPVLQIGIRTWRTRGGKVKSEIIRDGYLNKTKFWG